jgi:site-specific recombinase XerD
MTTLAPHLQAFFTDRLMRQRDVSSHTVEAYSIAFRLLLGFAQQRTGKAASTLLLEDLDASLIGAFLNWLETKRNNSVRSRNARLAAIHSFFSYVAVQEPAQIAMVQRVLAIPQKRFKRRLVRFLTRPEIDALLAAPNRSTWLGRRDHAIMRLAVETGLRVSELTGLHCEHVVLGSGPHVRCLGKGRKERCTPLSPQMTKLLGAWLRERGGTPSEVLFPSLGGGRLSRDAVERLVTKYAAQAREKCPSLAAKKPTPHVLRHTTAIQMLQAGVDRTVIALWLGHERLETTQMYLDADLEMKERALARTAPLPVHMARYKPPDNLLAFLQNL